jgi:hypothetical protein
MWTSVYKCTELEIEQFVKIDLMSDPSMLYHDLCNCRILIG